MTKDLDESQKENEPNHQDKMEDANRRMLLQQLNLQMGVLAYQTIARRLETGRT
jgi:hypothetical protein